MLEKIDDVNKINPILKKYFNVHISLENPFQQIIGYIYEKKIVGVLVYSVIYERIELDYIVVEENYRNKKIASKLMEYLIKLPNDNITLEVSAINKKAIELYKKYEFKEVKKIPHYYGKSDGILMIRR